MGDYLTYFNLALLPDQDIPSWDRLSRVWRMLHQSSAKSGAPFAVAFPGWMDKGFTLGDTLRVFTQGEQSANSLYDVLESKKGIKDLVAGSRVKTCKPAENQRWEACFMRRIPSGISKNRRSVNAEDALALQQKARERRIGQQHGMPFVAMRSSTGNGFRLVIERKEVLLGGESGVPNGYGLSRLTQVVPLPVIGG